MSENRLYRAPRDWTQQAVATLLEEGVRVFGPHREEQESVNLAPLSSAAELESDYDNVLLPLKSLFLPRTEVLVEFENGTGDVELRRASPDEHERVVLGCRPCDAAACHVIDEVFSWDYEDLPYRTRRERTTVISLACTEPAPECFCTSLEGSPHDERGSDVTVFTKVDDGVLLKVLSERGRALMEQLDSLVEEAPDAAPPDPPEMEPLFAHEPVSNWLRDNFDHDLWERASLRCVGCGACSYLCPTCHCFDIVDEGTWNRGKRRRNWDCCAFGLFTRHASGHNPRPDRASRYRQRIMHKFNYYRERFGYLACVGCGRCVQVCPEGQDVRELLQRIQAAAETGE